MIIANKLTKTYSPKRNPFHALKGVDLTIQDGESLAILGKSGSGKSTLMHILACLDRPTSGSVLVNSKDITKLNDTSLARLRAQEFGFIFQQFNLLGKATVLENVILPLAIGGQKNRIKRAEEALSQVGLADKLRNKASDLSGGQKQRVAIARAIVTNPKIIFADEPTGALDSETAAEIESLLFALHKKNGITLIIVTHDKDLAGKCSRIIQIKDGLIQN